MDDANRKWVPRKGERRRPLGMKIPRMLGFIITAALLLAYVADYSPQQLPVMIYKLALVTLATPLALYIDRSLNRKLFNSLDPATGDEAVDAPNLYAARLLARAVIYAAVVIGITLGI